MKFRKMEADMYNLYPSVGEVNGDHSNYSMAMIAEEKRRYGRCDVEIQGKKVEPRPEVRGEIARTYFYMQEVYPSTGIISRKDEKLLQAWDRSDPVDAWECERTRQIRKIQGNANSVVESRCEKSGF